MGAALSSCKTEAQPFLGALLVGALRPHDWGGIRVTIPLTLRFTAWPLAIWVIPPWCLRRESNSHFIGSHPIASPIGLRKHDLTVARLLGTRRAISTVKMEPTRVIETRCPPYQGGVLPLN